MSDARREVARAIVGFEARRDRQGRLIVYTLPKGDGGGRYEVAGICDRYHPHETGDLVALIRAGKHQEAEERAAEYIANYTDTAALWTPVGSVQAYLRDCIFNRGARGAAKILQLALGVVADGVVGPKTRAALGRVLPAELLLALRRAREDYERNTVGYRPQFWRGLVSRWDKALVMARRFL